MVQRCTYISYHAGESTQQSSPYWEGDASPVETPLWSLSLQSKSPHPTKQPPDVLRDRIGRRVHFGWHLLATFLLAPGP